MNDIDSSVLTFLLYNILDIKVKVFAHQTEFKKKYDIRILLIGASISLHYA